MNDIDLTNAGAGASNGAPAAAADSGAAQAASQAAGATDSNPTLEAAEKLSQYEKFVEGITPLLNKLDANPELVKAILADKVDTKLATALLDGKVKIEEAQQVVEAHEQVKQDLGKDAYANIDPAKLQEMVAAKATEIASETVERKLKDFDEEKQFEKTITDFIARTKDYPDFADEVNKWLAAHPDVTDIEAAYWAVKGKALAEATSKEQQKEAGEAAKDIAANAGGGSSAATGKAPQNLSEWDRLVAPRSNPNTF